MLNAFGGICRGDRETRSDGSYCFTVRVGGVRQPDEAAVSIHPGKSGYLFFPDSTRITLSRIDDVRDGGRISLADFRGMNCAVFSASDYFPLQTGASWIYDRTTNSAFSEEYVMSITGSSALNGQIYSHASPRGPAGFTDLRIWKNTVLTFLNGYEAEFLRFGAPPGTTWKIGKVSGAYPLAGTFMGIDTVTVPAGTYPDCMKYKLCTTFGETSDETCILWLAKGIGMVKSEKTLRNYGETKETVTDVLKRASR
jgi:hypothetical protein